MLNFVGLPNSHFKTRELLTTLYGVQKLGSGAHSYFICVSVPIQHNVQKNVQNNCTKNARKVQTNYTKNGQPKVYKKMYKTIVPLNPLAGVETKRLFDVFPWFACFPWLPWFSLFAFT